MDKQTAIDLLDNLLGMVEDNHESDYDTAIKMGIDVLKMQLSKEDATKDATFDCISRRAAINAMWKALHEYEDNTEKQFQESDELDVADWIVHRGFVQNMSDIDRQTILNLPSVQPDMSGNMSVTHKSLDCISRQAAIDAVCEYCEYFYNEKVIQRIKEIPSVQPQRWIPVSEALPEHSGFYIVTAIVTDDGGKLVGLRWFSQEHGWKFGKNPLAWMPLPEPWREQE